MPIVDDRRFPPRPRPKEPDFHDRNTPTEPDHRIPIAEDSQDEAHFVPVPADSQGRLDRLAAVAPRYARKRGAAIMVIAQLSIITATVFVVLAIQDCQHAQVRP